VDYCTIALFKRAAQRVIALLQRAMKRAIAHSLFFEEQRSQPSHNRSFERAKMSDERMRDCPILHLTIII